MKIQSPLKKYFPIFLIINMLALLSLPGVANTSKTKVKFRTLAQKTSLTINPISVKISIRNDKNNPIYNAQVILVGKNSTYLEGATNKNGIAELKIKAKQSYTLLVAHPNFPGIIVKNFSPQNDSKQILKPIGKIGSIIFPNQTGYIKGLKGRLNPILDNLYRTYVYADNIAINGGKQQPVYFQIGSPIHLEDSEGSAMQITVRFAQGNTFLIQFVKLS
ncbi:MAG: hypothetical protein ACK6A9_08325 [Dolichospermum sp.]|jgi:hypothetical protein|uniref:hypothetical protein n=1 Tax=Dolichospermum circinale TaxID=109265 RepID=UPI000415AB0B|nr:hypothetical protein [Dolichospermum circinale]MCE2719510.1 hypothetical protein [Anabaena sp. 49628_E55]MDB9474302.1 hypothetical protein [Dolichospermum circinale CS-537/11]MDB9477957.1 hypothetical protein [Dolichospermum circinale CS-537/03]MDB9548478.1 hypothetical protein [Dolichospermum circinale CS-1031]